jgi:hypothetical protein
MPLACRECGDTDGPFTADGRCEDCADTSTSKDSE